MPPARSTPLRRGKGALFESIFDPPPRRIITKNERPLRGKFWPWRDHFAFPLRAVGVRYLLASFGGGSRDSLRRFAREIVPLFEETTAQRDTLGAVPS